MEQQKIYVVCEYSKCSMSMPEFEVTFASTIRELAEEKLQERAKTLALDHGVDNINKVDEYYWKVDNNLPTKFEMFDHDGDNGFMIYLKEQELNGPSMEKHIENAIKYVSEKHSWNAERENMILNELCTDRRLSEVDDAVFVEVHDLMEDYGDEQKLPIGWWLPYADEQTIFMEVTKKE